MSWKIALAEYLRRRGLHGPWLLTRYGWLHDWGWFRSYREGRPVDGAGQPVPWLSYPSISFLQARLRPEVSVFEYGCGASTLWFAARVDMVWSAEHDEAWFRRVQAQHPHPERLLWEADAQAYPYAIRQAERRFDLILVDGIERPRCLELAPEYLTERGVIVLDNAERAEYSEALQHLGRQGFRKVEFVGMAPASVIETTTAVLYRDGNWLGL